MSARNGVSLRRRASAPTLAALLLLGLAACGGSDGGGSESDGDAAEQAREQEFASSAADAADQTVCAADATPLDPPYDAHFPTAWTFPDSTVVYDVEDRGTTGVIVTAVSTASFDDVLDHLNHAEVDAGFAITEGETEEDDAEANWTADGYTGRWTIRKSATCDGETVIQVLATQT